MSDALHKILEAVNDEQSFLKFVGALIEDRQAEVAAQKESQVDMDGRSPNGWENQSIESFLDAAKAWAEASHFGATQDLGSASPWKKFAVFLYCGKVYE